MSIKRTKEITITYYCRRRVSRRRTERIDCCPVCGNNSEMIPEEAAIRLVGISRSTLNRWVVSHQVHATRLIQGQLRICRGCLTKRIIYQ